MDHNHHSLRHYMDKHYAAIDEAQSYEELKTVALEVLESMPQPIGDVCGPTSTGGSGDLKKNLEIMEKTMHKLADQGKHIFNWVPFEKKFQHLREIHGTNAQEKNQFLLDRFYFHIFNSGLIKEAYFIHNWESSHGASWERELAKKLDIKIIDLPKGFLDS